MKKFLILFLLCLFPTLTLGCSNSNISVNEPDNAQTINSNQSIYQTICQDMNNVANTLRNLDALYYEDYAINELNPIVGYSTYQNQTQNYGVSANTKNIEQDTPASSYIVNDELLEYNYEPKYILDTNSLDTTYLLAYIQSLQDLFLITNDITAGNQILGTITYNVINEALNVKNSAGLANLSNLNLTLEQNYIFAECSIGINALLTSIANSSGFIDAELDSITTLRENYYKNIEALNIKYITILNIIDSRIVQIQNLEQLIERLNNQLLIIANSNANANNLANNYGLNQGINNNNYNENNNLTNSNQQSLPNNNYPNNSTYYNNNSTNNFGNNVNNNYNNELLNDDLTENELENNQNNLFDDSSEDSFENQINENIEYESYLQKNKLY